MNRIYIYFFAAIVLVSCKQNNVNPTAENVATANLRTDSPRPVPSYSIIAQAPAPPSISNFTTVYYYTWFTSLDTAFRLNSPNSLRTVISKFTDGSFQDIYVNNTLSSRATVAMQNNTTGYFTSSKGPQYWLHKTTDGGISWSPSVQIPTLILDIALPDTNTIYLTANSYIYKSTDGGATVNQSYRTNGGAYITNTFFYNKDLGFAGLDNGTLVRTANGNTWATVNTGMPGNIYDIFFADSNKGYLTSDTDSLLYVSNDGGKNWSPEDSRKIYRNANIFFYPDGRGIIVHRNRVYYSLNYGKQTFKLLNLSPEIRNKKIMKIDDNTVMIITDLDIVKVTFGS